MSFLNSEAKVELLRVTDKLNIEYRIQNIEFRMKVTCHQQIKTFILSVK